MTEATVHKNRELELGIACQNATTGQFAQVSECFEERSLCVRVTPRCGKHAWLALQLFQVNAAVGGRKIQNRSAGTDGAFQAVLADGALHLHVEIR